MNMNLNNDGMNLDGVLQDPTTIPRQASLVDHGWWTNGLVIPGQPSYDPSGSHRENDSKGDLEVEWGYGTIDPFYDEGLQGRNVVKRHIPENALGDAEQVIRFARDLMNRGFMGSALVNTIKASFPVATIQAASAGLREQFLLEGIVGCLAVDARGYGDPRLALAAADQSPHRMFIQALIDDPKDINDYVMLPSARGQSMVAAAAD